MKNSGSRIGNLIKSIFNVREWIDYERIRAFTLYLFNYIKTVFIPQTRDQASALEAADNFERARVSLNLSDEDLLKKQISLYRLSILMCCVGFIFLIYSLYHLFYGGFSAAIISGILMLISLVCAFRYHFWFFQIREKKLGCTFKEWYRRGFLGKKS